MTEGKSQINGKGKIRAAVAVQTTMRKQDCIITKDRVRNSMNRYAYCKNECCVLFSKRKNDEICGYRIRQNYKAHVKRN